MDNKYNFQLYSISYNDSNGIIKKGYSKMINKYPNPTAPKEYWFYNPAFIVERGGVLSIVERTTEKINLGDIVLLRSKFQSKNHHPPLLKSIRSE